MIYVLQARRTWAIKVGYSAQVSDRIAAIQQGLHEEVDLVFQFEGDRTVEAELLGLLTSQQLRGEWFAPTVETWRAIFNFANGRESTPISPPVKMTQHALALLHEGASPLPGDCVHIKRTLNALDRQDALTWCAANGLVDLNGGGFTLTSEGKHRAAKFSRLHPLHCFRCGMPLKRNETPLRDPYWGTLHEACRIKGRV